MAFIKSGSVLERMGFKMGDVIKSVEGRPVNNLSEFFQVLGYSTFDTLKMEVESEGYLTEKQI